MILQQLALPVLVPVKSPPPQPSQNSTSNSSGISSSSFVSILPSSISKSFTLKSPKPTAVEAVLSEPIAPPQPEPLLEVLEVISKRIETIEQAVGKVTVIPPALSTATTNSGNSSSSPTGSNANPVSGQSFHSSSSFYASPNLDFPGKACLVANCTNINLYHAGFCMEHYRKFGRNANNEDQIKRELMRLKYEKLALFSRLEMRNKEGKSPVKVVQEEDVLDSELNVRSDDEQGPDEGGGVDGYPPIYNGPLPGTLPPVTDEELAKLQIDLANIEEKVRHLVRALLRLREARRQYTSMDEATIAAATSPPAAGVGARGGGGGGGENTNANPQLRPGPGAHDDEQGLWFGRKKKTVRIAESLNEVKLVHSVHEDEDSPDDSPEDRRVVKGMYEEQDVFPANYP